MSEAKPLTEEECRKVRDDLRMERAVRNCGGKVSPCYVDQFCTAHGRKARVGRRIIQTVPRLLATIDALRDDLDAAKEQEQNLELIADGGTEPIGGEVGLRLAEKIVAFRSRVKAAEALLGEARTIVEWAPGNTTAIVASIDAFLKGKE